VATLSAKRVPGVVLGLTLFWGGLLSAFFWIEGFAFGFVLPWAGCLAAGFWIAHVESQSERKKMLRSIGYTGNELPDDSAHAMFEGRAFSSRAGGMVCSLGPFPWQQPPLPRLPHYEYENLLEHCPPELQDNEMLARTFGQFLSESYRQQYPAHTDLVDAILMTHLHPQNLKTPAGIDHHGGRSLLTHTLLVTALMAHRAPVHLYNPGEYLRAVDPTYKLPAMDPLIPIIGLCHDLGKIKHAVYDQDGKITHFLPRHDPQGARDLAQIRELWSPKISIEDRRIIQTLLGNYDRPSLLPVKRNPLDNKDYVSSDRLHALLGLMADCDRLAAALEAGWKTYDFDDQPIEVLVEPVRSEEKISEETFYEQIVRFISTAMAINAPKPNKSVGFKRCDEEFTQNRHFIIVDERLFAAEFAAFIGQEAEAQREGKTAKVTPRVLEALDEKGYLHRLPEPEGAPKRAATSCLYKISFKGNRPDGEPVFTLSPAFIIDATDWPSMSRIVHMPSCKAQPYLAGYVTGHQPRKTATGSTPKTVEDLAKKDPSEDHKKANKTVVRIRNALLKGELQVAAADASEMAIIGHDQFFIDLGLDIQAHDTPPKALEQAGITRIHPSKKEPEKLVIRLRSSLYASFNQPPNVPSK